MPPKQSLRSPVGGAPPPPPGQAQSMGDQSRTAWVPSSSNKRVAGAGGPPPPPTSAYPQPQGNYNNHQSYQDPNAHQQPQQQHQQRYQQDQQQYPPQQQQQHGGGGYYGGNNNNNYSSNNGGGGYLPNTNGPTYGGGGNNSANYNNSQGQNYYGNDNGHNNGPMAVDTTPTVRPTPHTGSGPEQHHLDADASETKPEAPKKNVSLKARGRLPEPKKKSAAAPSNAHLANASTTSPAPQDDAPMTSISEHHHQHNPYDISTTSALAAASVGTYNAPPPAANQPFNTHQQQQLHNNNYQNQSTGHYYNNEGYPNENGQSVPPPPPQQMGANRQSSYNNNGGNTGAYNEHTPPPPPATQPYGGGNYNNYNAGNQNYGGNNNNNQYSGSGQQLHNNQQSYGGNNYHTTSPPPQQGMMDSGSNPPPPPNNQGANHPYGAGPSYINKNYGGANNNNSNNNRQPGSPSYAPANAGNNFGGNNNNNFNNQPYNQNYPPHQQQGMNNYPQGGNNNNNNNNGGYGDEQPSYGGNQPYNNAPPAQQSWRNNNGPNNGPPNVNRSGSNNNAPPPPPSAQTQQQQQQMQQVYGGNQANTKGGVSYGGVMPPQQHNNSWNSNNNNGVPPPPQQAGAPYGSNVPRNQQQAGMQQQPQGSPNAGSAPTGPNNRQYNSNAPARTQPQQPQAASQQPPQPQQGARNRSNENASNPPQVVAVPPNSNAPVGVQQTLSGLKGNQDFDQTFNATASSSRHGVRSTNASPMPSANQVNSGNLAQAPPVNNSQAPSSAVPAAGAKPSKSQTQKQQPQQPQRGAAPAQMPMAVNNANPNLGAQQVAQQINALQAQQQQQPGGAPMSHITNAAASTLSYKNPTVARTPLYTLSLANGDTAVEYYLTKDNGDTSENRKSAGNSIPHLLAPRHQMMNNRPANSSASSNGAGEPGSTSNTSIELAAFDSHTYNNIVHFVDSVIPMVAAVHGGCAYPSCKCCHGTSAAEVTPIFQGLPAAPQQNGLALMGANNTDSTKATANTGAPAKKSFADALASNNKADASKNSTTATPVTPTTTSVPLPRTYHHEAEYHLKDMWEAFDCPYGVETALSTDIMSSSQARPATVHYSPILAGLHLTFAADSKYIRRQQARSRLVRERAKREGQSATQGAGPVEMESSEDEIEELAHDIDSENDEYDDLELSRSVSSASSLGTTNSASTVESGAGTGPSPLLNRMRQNQAIAVSAIIQEHRKKISQLPEFEPLRVAESNHKSKSEPFATAVLKQPVQIQQLFTKRREMIQKMKKNARRNAENILWISDENQPDRLPLFEQIETLAKHRYPALMKAKNTDFTFGSWVAVLWQPIFTNTHSAKKNWGKFLAFYAIRPPRFLFEPKMTVASSGLKTTSSAERVFSPLPSPHSVVGSMCSNLFCVANSNEQGSVIRTDRHALSINVWATGSHETLQKMIVTTEEPAQTTESSSAPANSTTNNKNAVVLGNSSAPNNQPSGADGAFISFRAHTKLTASVPIAGLVPIGARQDIWYMQQQYHYEGSNASSSYSYSHVAPLFLIASAANMVHQQQVGREIKTILQQGDVSINAIHLISADEGEANQQQKEERLTNPRFTPIISIPDIVSSNGASPLQSRAGPNSGIPAAGADVRIAELARRYELLNNSPVVMPNLSATRCDMLGRSLACGHKLLDYEQSIRADQNLGSFVALNKEMYQ